MAKRDIRFHPCRKPCHSCSISYRNALYALINPLVDES